MAVSLKTALTYLSVGICTLGLSLMVYISQLSQISIASLIPLDKRIAHTHEFNKALTFKKDIPVVYLSDVAARDRELLLEKINSRRMLPLSGRRDANMLQNRIVEDYRFCRKSAPFVGPFDYVSNSKNPCWYSQKGDLQCVPYFYLAGFSKSGTTDLFARIVSHPEIHVVSKEKHWLDFLRYFEDKDAIDFYAETFFRSAIRIDKKMKDDGYSNLVIGEGTPNYVWDSLYWPCYEGNRGLTEPKYTNADVIYRLNPQAKIILVLRDPVTRLYSRYLTWIKKLKVDGYRDSNPEHFHQITTRAIQLYTECFKEWSHRHCAYNGTLYAQSMSRLQEGMYSIYIRDWLKLFPRNQIMIMKFEDYITNVPSYLHKIFRFLNLTSLSDSVVEKISKNKARNVGSNYKIGPLMDETRDRLRTFYAPFNKDLQYVLDDTSWAWGYE